MAAASDLVYLTGWMAMYERQPASARSTTSKPCTWREPPRITSRTAAPCAA